MSKSFNPVISKLRPAIIGFESGEGAAIEYFFTKKVGLRPVAPEQADCFIVNGDRFSTLTQLKNQFPKAPQGVVISITQHHWPGYHWICKPYTSQDLEQALESLVSAARSSQGEATAFDFSQAFSLDQQSEALKQQLLQGDLAVSAADRLLARLNSAKPAEKSGEEQAKSADKPAAKSKLTPVKADPEIEKMLRCCGNQPDLDLKDPQQQRQAGFNPQGFILEQIKTVVTKADEAGTPVELCGDQVKIVYQPETSQFYHRFDEDMLLLLLQTRFRFGELEVRVCQTENLEKFLQQAVPVAKDAFLWQVALWSSKGRLLPGLNPLQTYALNRVPDFSRLIEVEYFNEIADLWSSHRLSLMDIVRILDIPQRVVFAFASAAFYLGWLNDTASAS